MIRIHCSRLNFISRLINSLLIILLFFFSMMTYAGAPSPSARFSRADTRLPQEIFGTVQTAGRGFQTWASTRGVTPDNNVFHYLAGESVRPAPIEDRNAGWVSVSNNFEGILDFLNMEVVPEQGSPPVERQTQWIYSISPSADAYSVDWMLADYLQRNDSQRVREGLAPFMEYANEEEWIVRGGVPVTHIQSARRYQYDSRSRQFLGTDEVVENPHFLPAPFPTPQVINPLTGLIPTTFYGYADPVETAQNATVPVFVPYSSSCASFGANSGPQLKNNQSKAPGCNYTSQAVKELDLNDVPTLTSQLVLNSGYCIQPVNALTPSKLHMRSYAYVNNCNANNSAQIAYYDLAKRIVIPKSQDGIELCLTAPENVINGHDQWDWVQFWPCDINNHYQNWYIKNGKFHLVLNSNYYLKFSGWYGIISANNYSGVDDLLNRNAMSEKFFTQQSQISSNKKEIGISWIDNHHYYYPSISGYSENYQNRTFYDMETKQILMLGYDFTPGFKAGSQWIKCLSSTQVTSGYWWDWAYWLSCDNSISQQWTIDNNESYIYKNPVENIHFKDANDNTLYFNLKNTSNYGAPYTESGKQLAGSFLNILRSYGICTRLNGWTRCAAPKHSTLENDGMLYN